MAFLPAVVPPRYSIMENIPDWLQLILAAVSGMVTAAGFSIRGLWKLSDRIRDLEALVGKTAVAEQIAKDRHDVIYPMVQAQFVLPLDRLEEEVKKQGQNIAILLDRNRLDTRLGEINAMLMSTIKTKEAS